MTLTETAKVLGLIGVVDNRNVDQATIAAWHDLIGPLDFDDALAAVRDHRRVSTAYLLPAHVIGGVRSIRAARLAAQPDPLPGVDPDDVPRYQSERRRLRAAAASPTHTRPALTRGN